MNIVCKCSRCGEEFEFTKDIKICKICGAAVIREMIPQIASFKKDLEDLVAEYEQTGNTEDVKKVIIKWDSYQSDSNFEEEWRDFLISLVGKAIKRKDKDLQRVIKNHAMEFDDQRSEGKLFLAIINEYPELGTTNDWDELIKKTHGNATQFHILSESIIDFILKKKSVSFAIEIFNLFDKNKDEWSEAGMKFIRELLNNGDIAREVFSVSAFNVTTSRFAKRLKNYCKKYGNIAVEASDLWKNYQDACKRRKKKAAIIGIAATAVILSFAIGIMVYLNSIDKDSISFTVDKVLETTYGEDIPLNGAYVTYRKNSGREFTEPLTEKMLHSYNAEDIGTQQDAYFEFHGVKAKVTVIITQTQLATPVLTQNENYITWESVLHADRYAIYVNATEVVTEQTSSLSYDLSSNSNYGELSITVRAITDSKKYASSALSEPLVVTKLEAPKNITYSSGVLTWKAVEGAVTYELVVNGTPYVTTEPSCEVMFIQGDNDVTINAKGADATVIRGMTVQKINYYRLDPITAMAYKNGEVSWSASSNVKSFAVYVNGEYWKDLSRNYFSVEKDGFVSEFGNGNHSIGIICKSVVAGAENSELVSFNVAIGNTIRMDNGEQLTWDSLGNGSTYFIDINGTKFTSSDAYFAISEYNWSVGSNVITITATDPDGNDQILEAATVTKLKAPTVKLTESGWINHESNNLYSTDGGNTWSDKLPEASSFKVGETEILAMRKVSSDSALEIPSDTTAIKIYKATKPTISVIKGEMSCYIGASLYDSSKYTVKVYYKSNSSDTWVGISSLSEISQAGEYQLYARVVPNSSAFGGYSGLLSSENSDVITVTKLATPDVSYDKDRHKLSSTSTGAKFYYLDSNGGEIEIKNGDTSKLMGGIFEVYARVEATEDNTLDSDNTPMSGRVSVFNLDITFKASKSSQTQCYFVFQGCENIDSLTFTYMIEYYNSSNTKIGTLDKTAQDITLYKSSSSKNPDIIQTQYNVINTSIVYESNEYSAKDITSYIVYVYIDGGMEIMTYTSTVSAR